MRPEKEEEMKTECAELTDGIALYTVSNGRISFCAMNYGCTLTKLLVPNKAGGVTDILLGYDTLDAWQAGTEAHNAVVGRVANRIGGAAFALDGKVFSLDKNDGENCLHGGFNRFEKMLWRGESFSEADSAGVRFTRTSVAGEQGFPGNVELCVTYRLTARDELVLEYTAASDAPTPINLTNHAYFNLNGAGNVLGHHLRLDCDEVLEIGADMIPTGRILDVTGTPFDFRAEKLIGRDIGLLAELGGMPLDADSPFGYDHCFVTHADEAEAVHVGTVWSDESGICMDICTNQRGMQLYTGNFLGGVQGKGGVVHRRHDGVCFETQRFPDAVNKPRFPNCILRPGERYWSKTIFSFK